MRTLAPHLLAVALPVMSQAKPARPAPLTDADFRPPTAEQVELAQLLFWDAELSGNRNISCGGCHHPRFGTSDGLSLGMGEGCMALSCNVGLIPPARRVCPPRWKTSR